MIGNTRYLYMRDNYYACLEAVDLQDAKQHLKASGVKLSTIVRVDLDDDLTSLIDMPCQNIRRAVHEGARTRDQILLAIQRFEDFGWIPNFN